MSGVLPPCRLGSATYSLGTATGNGECRLAIVIEIAGEGFDGDRFERMNYPTLLEEGEG